jgi:Cu+-exporting ATPase
MLLSFPEYFDINEFWLDSQTFFRSLIFTLSLPAFFYSQQVGYVSAYKVRRKKMLNIDVPIALGIIVMFFVVQLILYLIMDLVF